MSWDAAPFVAGRGRVEPDRGLWSNGGGARGSSHAASVSSSGADEAAGHREGVGLKPPSPLSALGSRCWSRFSRHGPL
jgi:hypothetical protein